LQSHKTNNTSLKTTESPKIVLKIASNDGIKRFTEVRYLDAATLGFDNGFDGETFSGTPNSLDIFSSLLENASEKKYQVQSIPNSNYENMTIPIGISAVSQKNITFSVEFHNLPSGYNVYLEDRVDQKVTEFSDENTSVQVSVEGSETLGRFFLHLRTTGILSATHSPFDGVQVYKTNENDLRIIGLNNENVELTLYTILGQKALSTFFKGVKDYRISLPKLSSEMYIVNLKTENGELIKKIIKD